MTISNWFLRLAAVSAVIGVAWGVYMGASHDHLTSPAHAHLNLLGWVSMALFGLFYRQFPAAGSGILAKTQLGASALGLVLFIPALALKLAGPPSVQKMAELGLMIGPMLTLLAIVIFAVVVFMHVGRRDSAAA